MGLSHPIAPLGKEKTLIKRFGSLRSTSIVGEEEVKLEDSMVLSQKKKIIIRKFMPQHQDDEDKLKIFEDKIIT